MRHPRHARHARQAFLFLCDGPFCLSSYSSSPTMQPALDDETRPR
ncbi:hypothetical protein CGRA01v4_14454 [Colletotrichum graminicola]|nr:hypothetical protein CGRA01v4_14454 [Colletotrichum graminicola]